MKSKFSYKSKRTIIIAAIITVLLAGTATGVYFFTKGNAQAQAAGDNNTTQEQYGDAPEENKNEQQNNTTENEQNKNEQGETTPNQQEEQETERQEQTTNNNQTTQNEQTTTTTTGEVPNQEYVTEREETVKNPWESLEVGWGPTQFASIASTANLTAKKSNLEIHKTVDKESVKIGDTHTYTISVKNNGDKVAKAIIYDNVPEGTVLLNKDNNEDENTKKLTWRVTVEPGETEKVEFTVRVKAEKGTIKNSAIINGKTTNETETGIINITGKKEVNTSEAKVGDTLTYIITLTNNGNADGTVTVTDEIPTGTRIKDENTTGYNKETNTMTWSNVEVKANGGTATLTLEVVVKDNTTDTVKNVAKIDNKEIPEKPETKVANITGAKSVDKPTAKVGDTLTYTIKLTNSGNGDGKVTVTDEIPTGTRIKDENTTGYNKETNTMTWSDVEVKAGKSVELTLEVVVEDNISIIKNIAYVDGNKIPEEPETSVRHHYTVEHYTENLDGKYSKVEKDTVVSEDVEIGTKVSYENNNYEGFTFDDNKTENKDATVPDNNNLVVKLYYTRRNDLSYTVNYLEKDTNTVLHEAKTAGNQTFGTIITSSDEVITIDGYNYDSVDKTTLTIGTSENVINIYYTKRTDLSYTVNYLEKDTNTVLHEAKTAGNQTFGTIITSSDEVITIDGYNYDSADKTTLTIGTGENVINIYYTKRTDLSYTVNYLEKDTNTVLHEAKTAGNQTFGTIITSSDEVITIDGYNYDSVDKTTLTIGTGENVINIYYTKRTDLSYTVYYKEQGTETKLADAKVVNNKTFEEKITASIKAEDNTTEKPKPIDGYECVEVKPGTLLIGTGENVITFYYVKLCQYKIEYYLNGNLAEQYTVGPEKIRVGTTIGFETKTEELEKIDSAISGYQYIKYVGVDGKDNGGTTAYRDMNVIKVYYGLPVTSIKKTATELVNAGDEIEYTIEVSNTGDWKTTITVTDTLEKTEYVDGSSNVTPSIDGKTLSWSIELEARGSETISFRAKTNNKSYGDEISNTAKIKGTDKEDTAVTKVNEIDVTYSEWLEGQKGTDLNIVFVLDNSSSMNFPIADKTYVKDEYIGENHVTPIAPSDKDKTRIENAKSAINSFIDSQANNKNTTMEVVTFNKSKTGTAKNMMTLMDIPDKDIQYRENFWDSYYYIEINGIECRVKKNVTGTDGKKHCGVYIPIEYGARLIGDNSASNDILKKNVSEISISSEQNGFGTYVEPAFKVINDNKEKQYLKDGKKNIIIVLADGIFSDNYNNELQKLKNTLKTNGGEIYCVGFGSGTEYDSTALAKMSTNNKCYEAKDASTLLTKFNEILASVGKTQSGRTQNGKITFEEAKNTIKVSEECPIVATYGDSENETVLFTCTSDNADEMWNKYGLKIDGKIISWDAKQFAIANEGIKVPNNIKIKYYIARQ